MQCRDHTDRSDGHIIKPCVSKQLAAERTSMGTDYFKYSIEEDGA